MFVIFMVIGYSMSMSSSSSVSLSLNILLAIDKNRVVACICVLHPLTLH